MIAVKALQDCILLRPDFDLVNSNLDAIKNIILDLAGRGSYQIVLDLPRDTVIDSMGIGVIVACVKTLKQYDSNLTVKTDNPDIIDFF
ncbi:MAG: STAS domain-containing protein, partial [Deltaproteobacteria bacterium]|nr:STAS domain-containing protein [Deltaproteobacteria bacterium]